MSDEIPSYKPKDVPGYLTEEESTVLSMLAKKMICPSCDAPLELKPTTRGLGYVGGKITWHCTNENCFHHSKFFCA